MFRLDHIQSTIENFIADNKASDLLSARTGTAIENFEGKERLPPNINNQLQPRFKSTAKPPGKKCKNTT